MKTILVAGLSLLLTSCAGVQVEHSKCDIAPDRFAKYLLLPFRDPSYKNLEYPGVGARFTRSFASQCSLNGLNVVEISNEDFSSAKDIDMIQALAYAEQNGFDYLITGHVTRWIDRPTEWSGKRDFAGLEVFVREVKTKKVVFASELLEHSNIFWSGTPDDFVVSLSKAMVDEFLGIKSSGTH